MNFVYLENFGILYENIFVVYVMSYEPNRLWKFHKIYHFSAVGDRDELIRLWGQKFKIQGHNEVKKHFERHLLHLS